MAEAAGGSRLRGVAHRGPLRGLRGPASAGSPAPPRSPPSRFAIFPPGPRGRPAGAFSLPALGAGGAEEAAARGAAGPERRCSPSRGPRPSPRGCVRMEQPGGGVTCIRVDRHPRFSEARPPSSSQTP
ncbi:unnamed protein product [Nyctereutes procyonoides]|uniref:(raccoon dog) hypothetical protein n=1 Tax=Nyctereutes procyonoides TaxID=34880 RepID=A0A811YJD9_NYCPR|nr:unnamed protein product [Nyctereutes procyonoides]